MSLTEYKCKRRFNRTPEPSGKRTRSGGRSFVVQKHQASRLHYDFRLELDGVLKSWAIPKGPSLDPIVKRLAMHVEDHPVEYGRFEGVIPQGEYGGGTVMLWDRGRWEPIGDPEDGYRRGRLKFRLHGDKLRGGWMLVRTGGHSEKDERRWLLFKERDDAARPDQEVDILTESPLSVTSGRSLDDIATDRDQVWSSGAKSRSRAGRPSVRKTPGIQSPIAKVPGQKARQLPTKVEVQLPTLAKDAPQGDDWVHEIKLDGYRMICRIRDGRAQFISRNNQDWTRRLPALAEAAQSLPLTQAILDGEIVVLRPDGTTNFQDLQNAFRAGSAEALQYCVFDLLHLDGHDLTLSPLDERKRVLARLLTGKRRPASIRLTEHITGNGPSFLKRACELGLEGIVSKRRDGPYRAGRGYDWLKVKCTNSEEFVIGGYTEPAGARAGFGALLVGYHDPQGQLVYAGKVGTGFDDRTLRSLFGRLKPLHSKNSPFADRRRASKTTQWVEPRLVAQVAFAAWTNEGLLRHASFQGLREDKSPHEVARERASARSAALSAPRTGAESRRKSRSAKVNAAQEHDAVANEFAGVRLTSPAKVLFPDRGITKLDLATYYRMVSDWLLPHITDRPLVLVRCPEGQHKACFYQKHPASGTPDTLRRIPIREKNETEDYVIADDVAALISLAQIGALEIHAWGSRADKLEYPDRLIFDLDPDPTVPWNRVVASALQVRDFLQELGLESFVKTTGGKGLHLVLPIDRRHDWEEVKAFCKRVADAIVAADPRHYTATMAKAARKGKIFIDYLRNARGATAVVPYSPRARPAAPISVPLAWTELRAGTSSDRYTIQNLARRLASLKRDPWAGMASLRQGLTAPLAKLRALTR